MEPVKEVDCALCVCGGAEDFPVVILENLKPGRKVGGVVVLNLRSQFQVGAKKCGTQLSYEFLAGVTFVAPGLAAEIAC